MPVAEGGSMTYRWIKGEVYLLDEKLGIWVRQERKG
jgi:hypothetical protein